MSDSHKSLTDTFVSDKKQRVEQSRRASNTKKVREGIAREKITQLGVPGGKEKPIKLQASYKAVARNPKKNNAKLIIKPIALKKKK
jgi:hypothetical protein